MKLIKFLSLSIILSIVSCESFTSIGQPVMEVTSIKNQKGEWELKVLDSEFDTFLISKARPRTRYTKQFLRSKNIFLTQEWNSYFYTGSYRNIIKSSIHYDTAETYGFEFEYKLYQFFVYMHRKYNTQFNHLDQMDRY